MRDRCEIVDFWKFVAAVGVIFVHVEFPGIAGTLLKAVGTCGVTYFFLISGYACCGESGTVSRIKRRLRRNGLITLFAISFSILFSYLFYRREGLLDIWKSQFTGGKRWIIRIVFGDFDAFFAPHLWFLVALVYCYLLFMLVAKFKLHKVVFVLLIPLLALRIFVETYVNSYSVTWHYSGNFLVGALPAMALGYVIAYKKDKIFAVPRRVFVIVSVVSAALMFLTVCIKIGGLDLSQPFKILLAACLFVLGVSAPDKHICKPVETLGREDPLIIYLCHYPILMLLAEFMYSGNNVHLSEEVADLVLPIAVVVASLLFARLFSLSRLGIKKLTSEKK